MTKAERQLKKDIDYFEKMKETILEDLKDGRAVEAIAGSINRKLETLYYFMRQWNVKDAYGNPIDQHYDELPQQCEKCKLAGWKGACNLQEPWHTILDAEIAGINRK